MYKIFYSKEQWKKRKLLKSDLVGVCLLGKTTILIKEWLLSPTQLRDTLFHEVLHACWGLSVLDSQPFGIPDNMHDIEELMTLLLAPHLLQVLQENPEFVDWLLDV